MQTKTRCHRLWLAVQVLLVCFLLLGACTSQPPAQTASTSPAGPTQQPEVSHASTGDEVSEDDTVVTHVPLDPRLIAAHNRFGWLLLRELLGQTADAEESIFLSPTSIALALGMAFNGASGTTQTAMAEALQLRDLSRGEINEQSLALLQTLDRVGDGDAPDPGVRLDIANSLWHRQDVALNQDFLADVSRFYRAEVQGLDFTAPASVNVINDWVSKATQGLIPSVVDELDPDLALLLVNAVYFKGDWTTPFDKALTSERPFHPAAGPSRPVSMMRRSGTIDYFQDEAVQAVRLPYGKDERVAMYVFLPHAGSNVRDVVASWSPESLEQTFSRFAKRYGEVLLPRIDLRYKAKLKDPLSTLGMSTAFDAGQADFGRMGPVGPARNFYLGNVLHQSVLQVDEEGTEAAAVTSIDVRVTSVPVYDFRFEANRPFIIAIRDDVTGALLFLGVIMDPDA